LTKNKKKNRITIVFSAVRETKKEHSHLRPANNLCIIMIAIAKIGGHQAILSVGETIEIDKIEKNVGETIEFPVLLLSETNGTNCQIGDPVLKDIFVEAKILEHGRGEKIRVFKMKTKKRYRKTQGHRQDYTLVEITKVGNATTNKKTTKTTKKESTQPEITGENLSEEGETK